MIFYKLIFLYYRDRFFTVHNVWGGCVGAGVIDHFSKKEQEQVKYLMSDVNSNFDNIDSLTNNSEIKTEVESLESEKTGSVVTIIETISTRL